MRLHELCSVIPLLLSEHDVRLDLKLLLVVGKRRVEALKGRASLAIFHISALVTRAAKVLLLTGVPLGDESDLLLNRLIFVKTVVGHLVKVKLFLPDRVSWHLCLVGEAGRDAALVRLGLDLVLIA